MNDDVVRAAMWANDLARLRPSAPSCGEYAMVEVRSAWQVPRLARAMDEDESAVRERFERGCRAFAAWSWQDEAVANWLWVSTGEEYAPPLRRTFRIPEGDCYGWNAGTVEAHRGRGLFVSLLEWAGLRMAEAGMSTMWNGIHDDNLAQPARPCAGRLPAGAAHGGRSRAGAGPAPDYADERMVARARQLVGVRHAALSRPRAP